MALYSSAQTTTFSLSFRVFDALLTPDDISNYFALEDLRNIWDGHDTLRTREDSTARARCGKEGIVRVERIILHDGFQMETESDEETTGPASLTRKLLQSTLNFETRLSEILAERRAPCVRSPAGRCLVLSPLAFWDYDEDALLKDPAPHEAFGPGRNVSLHGLTVTSDMVLAGGDDEGFDRGMALYPVLTYYFPETDCLANGGHYFWLNAIEKASSDSGAEVIVVSKAPRLIALQVRSLGTPMGTSLILCSIRRKRELPRVLLRYKCSHTLRTWCSLYISRTRCDAWIRCIPELVWH